MRKVLHLFCATVLMSAISVGFTACEEPKLSTKSEKPEENLQEEREDHEVPAAVGITPLATSEIPDKVADFFEENPTIFDGFFDKIDKHDDTPTPCFTINSMEEFREYTSNSAVLPEIDFGKYTIVIARYYVSDGRYLKSHAINTEPDVMNLNFVFGDPGKGLTMISAQMYCEFYPKLPQKPIEINSITIKEY